MLYLVFNSFIISIKKKYLNIWNNFMLNLGILFNYLFTNILNIIYIFLLFFVIYIYLIFLYNTLPFINILSNYIMFFLLLYILISIFIKLNKDLKFGKYTSFIQRFYKRSYFLFWSLELVLFFIFTFTLFVHHKESSYFLDIKFNFFNFDYLIYNYIFSTNLILILLVCNYCILIYSKSTNKTFICLLFSIYNFFFLLLIYNEFFKFYLSLSYINDIYNIILISDNNFSYNLLNINLKYRCYLFYVSIISIVKFWHIIFLYIYFTFFLNNFMYNNSISYSLCSSNTDNILFLFLFNVLSYVWLLKNFILFFINFMYTWFFFNFNFFNIYLFFNEFFYIFILCVIT